MRSLFSRLLTSQQPAPSQIRISSVCSLRFAAFTATFPNGGRLKARYRNEIHSIATNLRHVSVTRNTTALSLLPLEKGDRRRRWMRSLFSHTSQQPAPSQIGTSSVCSLRFAAFTATFPNGGRLKARHRDETNSIATNLRHVSVTRATPPLAFSRWRRGTAAGGG